MKTTLSPKDLVESTQHQPILIFATSSIESTQICFLFASQTSKVGYSQFLSPRLDWKVDFDSQKFRFMVLGLIAVDFLCG